MTILQYMEETDQLSIIYDFLHDNFLQYLKSDQDATDKMLKILEIIKT